MFSVLSALSLHLLLKPSSTELEHVEKLEFVFALALFDIRRYLVLFTVIFVFNHFLWARACFILVCIR